MHRALIGFLLLASPVAAQSNIVIGVPSWKATLFVPDPAFNSGPDDKEDQFCQVNNAVYPTQWGGAQNQVVLSCFSVPNPVSGVWSSQVRLRGYSGHHTGTYFAGYEIGVEGQRVNGVETVNRWYLWRYEDGAAILSIGKPYPNILNVGNAAHPISLYLGGGSIDVPNGWTQTKVLRLYSNPIPACTASAAGRFNYAAGSAGVKDSVAVCAKDASNAYAWRTIY